LASPPLLFLFCTLLFISSLNTQGHSYTSFFHAFFPLLSSPVSHFCILHIVLIHSLLCRQLPGMYTSIYPRFAFYDIIRLLFIIIFLLPYIYTHSTHIRAHTHRPLFSLLYRNRHQTRKDYH
jgi:hypothetical protein